MNIQQLRYLHEIARNGLNVSDAAAALYTSQPGVSKQVRLLEDELGISVFQRAGKRLTGITEPGRQVLDIVARMLDDARNLKRVGEEYADDGSGTLDVATTHTQARYPLPPVVQQFMARHPRVRLRLHQGNPEQVAQWVIRGDADIGIATEALDRQAQLVTLPCYQWSHIVVTPSGHPLATGDPLSLASLARWPLITYDPTFTGRTRIDHAFERASIAPNIVLTAVDSDIVKTYVELGLGVGIIAAMAYDAARDSALAGLPASHLFESNTTRLAIRRGTWLRRFDYDFIELFAPRLTRQVVELTLKGGSIDPGL